MTKQETIKLGWELIEHKIRYYEFAEPIIGDVDYDMLERQYTLSCIEHDIENTISCQHNNPTYWKGMIGCDMKRPSVQMVYDKLMGIEYNGPTFENK